jgi:uncharacterized membrane protein YfcA
LEIINSHPLSDIIIFYFVALLVGMSKTGIHGTGMLAVPLLAVIFGGMNSSGVMLPILCIADIFGVTYYHRHASWQHLRLLFPSAAVGIILGSQAGAYIDDSAFRFIMAFVIFASVALMVWLERNHKKDIPQGKVFSNVIGATGGFTSMIGNLAGSVMAVYFIAMRLPKNVFIGTTAWFFMVINLFKVPFHVFHWKTITVETLLMDLTAIPPIALGAYIGIAIVKQMNDSIYRWFILGMTVVAAIIMVLQNYS